MFDYIVKDVMEVMGYLPIGILCGVAAVILYFICAGRRKDGRRIWAYAAWFLLAAYMAVMVITVFLSREPGSRQGIDLTLFGTWGETPQAHAFVIENILLFVPFGILFPFVVKGIWTRFTVPVGFLTSVCIELIQLITERGYCQLDDVVMNTLGTLIGYVIYVVVKYVWKKTVISI